MARIFVTRKIPEIGFRILTENQIEFEVYPGNLPISHEQLIEKVSDVDGILCLVTDRIDRKIIDAAPRLKIISNYAVGVDNIDVEYASRKNILVTNTPDVLTDATADLTWALLLAVTRRILEGDRMVRAGQFKTWDPLLLLGGDLKGRTLGIIGAGRIGRAVAQRARGWNMNILYYSRNPKPALEERLNARKVSLETLLKESDFVSIHVPLSAETHHLIGKNELQLMKPTAYLINTARGPIVDEQALIAALQEKHIAGAALDVFENEPQVPEALKRLDNVVLTPHIGSATFDARNGMARIAATNLVNFFQGKKPLSMVNPEVWQKRHSQ